MINTVRYFENVNTKSLSVYRALEKDETLWVMSGEDLSGNPTYTELTEDQYNTVVAEKRKARQDINADHSARQGILTQLIENAGKIIGGIL